MLAWLDQKTEIFEHSDQATDAICLVVAKRHENFERKTNALVYPLFIIREGGGSFVLQALEPFRLPVMEDAEDRLIEDVRFLNTVIESMVRISGAVVFCRQSNAGCQYLNFVLTQIGGRAPLVSVIW